MLTVSNFLRNCDISLLLKYGASGALGIGINTIICLFGRLLTLLLMWFMLSIGVLSSELARPLLGMERPRGSKCPMVLTEAIFCVNLCCVECSIKASNNNILSKKRKMSCVIIV